MNMHCASSPLAADVETVRAFLNAIFAHADDGTFIALRAFRDNGKHDEKAVFTHSVRVGSERLAEEVTPWIIKAANWPTPAVFCPPIATFTKATGATTADLANGVALSVECDSRPSSSLARLTAILGPPTVTAASGGEWLNLDTGEVEPKLHLHWRMNEPTRDTADHERLYTARLWATRIVGADATGVPLVHPFRWPGSWHRKAEPRLAKIVRATENEIDLADALERLKAALPAGDSRDTAHRSRSGGPKCKGPFGFNTSDKGLEADDALGVVAALAVIGNADLPWDGWNKIGMAIWAATAGKGFAIFDTWSQKSAKYDAETTRGRWEHYETSPPNRIGAGSLFFMAREARPGWSWPSEHEQTSDERRNATGTSEQPSTEPPASLDAKPFVWRDPAMIEPRRWLYGHHLIRGFLSATVAPGGVGKSSLALVEALAMATGRDLLGHKPAGKLRVWYWNGEDPEEELNRRIAAICLHYGITAEEIGDRLFVNSGRDTEIVMATETKAGVVIAEPVAAAVLATVEKNRIDVMMVDPFVASHEVSENDNNKINAVARRWSKIADAAGCAVELVHHARKVAPGQAEIAVEDARGASALIAAVRSARTLNGMTKDEAEKAGVKQPRLHFRVDNGKANLAPPPEATTWHKLIGVPLGNARDDRPEDYVGVVTAWTWPNPFDDVTTRDLRAVQARIAEGEWRADPQADAWAGKAVAEVLRLDPSDKAVEAKAKGLLKVWIETGMLKVVEKPDHKRNLRKFVEVAQWAND